MWGEQSRTQKRHYCCGRPVGAAACDTGVARSSRLACACSPHPPVSGVGANCRTRSCVCTCTTRCAAQATPVPAPAAASTAGVCCGVPCSGRTERTQALALQRTCNCRCRSVCCSAAPPVASAGFVRPPPHKPARAPATRAPPTPSAALSEGTVPVLITRPSRDSAQMSQSWVGWRTSE